MADLAGSIESAFDETVSATSTEGASNQAQEPETAQEAPETQEAQPSESTPDKTDEEPTGDVLLDKLTPDQIAELKKDPRLRAIYKGLMSSYTPKMQQFAEQARLWDALNNEGTRRQAVEALARAVGLDIKPTDQPQRQQAAQVADEISDEWSNVVGSEAARWLRPLIEKTALAAVNWTLQPLQQATEYLQMDARSRQAEAQVSQFRATAAKKGWNVTPDVEARMAELGQQVMPSKPIETVQDGIQHLERLYRLATAETAEADMEKRILERMKKAAQTAEPSRGVPSTGRDNRTNIPAGASLDQALDIAFSEEARKMGLR